jgi:hypothetical protein
VDFDFPPWLGAIRFRGPLIMFAQIPTASAATDWVAIGKMIAEILGGLVIAWTAWKQQKTSTAVATIVPVVASIAPVVQATAEKLEVVHKLTNSNLGEQLRIGAIAARTLAISSKLPEHVALAEVAENKVRLHEADQARVDAGKVA